MPGKTIGTDPTLAAPLADPSTAVSSAKSAPTLAAESVAASIPVASTPHHHVLGGRYEILGLVGAGGMGTVYRARDRELDEVVALKMLRRDVLGSPGILDRFRQEAKLARRVTHANVARTYDIGEADGEKFLTMEFVEGESLASRIARDGQMAIEDVVRIASAICAGLEAAHDAGVLHRDLKPDNVLLGSDGRVVITDFGIARALSDPARAATVGLALGTPSYMAPEQVEGVTDLDARADVYALGAILYECFVGDRAWNGDGVFAIAAARLLQPPPDPRVLRPDLPTGAAALVLQCMARQRQDRYAAARDVAAALASLTLPVPVVARRSAPPPAVVEGDAKIVAVLPFRNHSSADDAYIAEGLGDDLVDALSMTPGLRVLARGAVAAHKGSERDVREIGRELRVHVVVDGSVRRQAHTLRVTARVISVADGFQLWAKRFDRPENELLTISDDVANAVAQALTVRRNAPARVAPKDGRAIELYLKARLIAHRGWREDMARAAELFEEALTLAPDDATILASYARTLVRQFTFSSEPDVIARAERLAKEYAARALELAPHSGEARAALAHLKWSLGDALGCARDLREAVRLSPSSGDVNELYGRMLVEAGEPEKAIACLSSAVALEPSIDLASGDLLRGRALLGDWSAYEAEIDRDPAPGALGAPRWFLLARLTTWRRDAVTAAAFREKVLRHDFALKEDILRILDLFSSKASGPEIQAALDRWGSLFGRARRGPIFFRQLAVELSAFVGDHDVALRALDEADALGLIDLTWVDRCPLLAPIRDEARFRAARSRIATRARDVLDVLEGRTP